MIEICCGSYEDALAAWKGGAERIELNRCGVSGSLTPSIGSLRLVKENTGLKVISMVRPEERDLATQKRKQSRCLQTPVF